VLPRALGSVLLLLCLTGCGSHAFETNLTLIFDDVQSPMSGAAEVRVDAIYPDGEPITHEFAATRGEHRLDGLVEGSGVVFEVHISDSASEVLALGVSQPVDVGPDGDDVGVFVGEVDSLARVPTGLEIARTWAGAVSVPGGRVVVVGGGDNADATIDDVEFVGWSPDAPLAGMAGAGLPRIGHQTLYVPADAGGTWAGKVAVIGGTFGPGSEALSDGFDDAPGTVSLVDPDSGEVQRDVEQLGAGYLGFRAAFTREGRIALVGGMDETTGYVREVRLLDPESGDEDEGPNVLAQEQHSVAPLRILGEDFLLISGGLIRQGGERGEIHLWTGLLDDEPDDLDGLELVVARARHQVSDLGNGQALITGGADQLGDEADLGQALDSAEIFDPVFRSSTAVDDAMLVARQSHVAVAIPDDRILICGGVDSEGIALGSCEVYFIEDEGFSAFTRGSMNPGGPGIAAAPFGDGRILFVGGASEEGPDDSLYLYTPPELQR
jgi:hypothetical protein